MVHTGGPNYWITLSIIEKKIFFLWKTNLLYLLLLAKNKEIFIFLISLLKYFFDNFVLNLGRPHTPYISEHPKNRDATRVSSTFLPWSALVTPGHDDHPCLHRGFGDLDPGLTFLATPPLPHFWGHARGLKRYLLG